MIGGNHDATAFSEGVVAGNTLYIAGTLGLDPATAQAPADVKAEAQLLMTP